MGADPIRVAAICALGALSMACASYRVVDPTSGPIELADDEGLVVLHVAPADVPIESLYLSGVAVDVPSGDGERVWLVVTSPGRRSIRGFRARDPHENLWTYLLPEDTTGFDVVAGQISYPGLLEVDRPPSPFVFVGEPLRFRLVNRSAVMLELLEERHPEVLARYPLRYTGRGVDRFLESLERLRSAARDGPAVGENVP
jgi:hypothetical protein